MSVTWARPPDLRADVARKRAQLLATARRYLAAGTELPLNAIARDAGVGVGTAYRHFPTRASLVEALAIDSFEELLRAVREALGTGDSAAALRAIVTTAFDHLCAEPALAELLAAGAFSCVDTKAAAGDLVTAFTDLLRRAHADGALADDIGPDDVRRLLCGAVAAATCGPAHATHSERYVDVLLRGMGAIA